jgi:membrane fusion protein (multidrug efflux system)
MYVRVKLITGIKTDAVLVPKSAILYDENRQYVFLVKDDKSVKITLNVGYSDTYYVESISDIEAGDQVVVVGQNGLKDGTKVRIVSSEDEGEETSPSASN